MIIVYTPNAREKGGDRPGLEARTLGPDEPLPQNSLWIDMLEPTRDEDHKVERHLGVEIPTREEMRDIEPSEIIYAEANARYMTARILCSSDSAEPLLANISFILTERALVTVRYDQPKSFSMFAARSVKPGGCGPQPESVLDGLIETIIDRAAEILANLGGDIEKLSRSVFEEDRRKEARGPFLRSVIRTLGRKGDVISNVRESMVSVERVLLFLSAAMARPQKAAGFQAEWRTALRDVQSLEEHATFLSSKIQFLLDATLGLVSLEQNDIIKLFSVMAVVLMPPTLIASIYGMNFKQMPELEWAFGYPMAIVLMVICGVLPFFFFRWKRWL
ncbi:magnesium transporter CorA family protein [Terrarubrum flagellatum]|uniref:magnesium transporter CorA family protein n=1 Tax=Terrirubrum flagellatum TaxID=2895980 RepID=UPI0031453DB8